MGRMDGDMAESIEIADPRGRIAQLEVQCQRLTHDLSVHIKENAELRRQLDGKAKELAMALRDLDHMRAENGRLKAEVERLRFDLSEQPIHAKETIHECGHYRVTVTPDGHVTVERA